MSRAQQQFENTVQDVLRDFGVDDTLVDGAIGLRYGEDEIWLQVEPTTAPMRTYQRNVQPFGFQLAVRSRIYTFRQKPADDVLERIEQAAEGLPSVVYIQDKQSLYAQLFLPDPTVDGLVVAIRSTSDLAQLWLESKLFEVMRAPGDGGSSS
ncbi:MAG: hypothetical protein AAF449_05785 [Myxococcota bacterium]